MQTAHNLAASWTNQYFANRGFVPTAQQWRAIYDAALGRYLKQLNS